MDDIRFSIFTATYNRAKYLNRLYSSLKSQTFKDFEWIIIDDGSTDDTENVVQSFINEQKLKKIKYLKKDNGGKHTAWKLADRVFSAPYVIAIDSDDTLLPGALEIFNRYWEQLESSQDYHLFWEVKGRCQNEKGELLGGALPDKIFDSNTDEMVFKYGFKKEMHACRKSIVLRNEASVPENFPFQEKCNNFSESIRWSRAGKKFKTRYFDEVVRTYYSDAEDSLTSKKNISQSSLYNSLVQTIYAIQERSNVMLKWDMQSYLKTIIIFYSTCFSLKHNPVKILRANAIDGFFIELMIIPSYVYWMILKKNN